MGVDMKRAFTLEYWQDDGWYVGKLKEIPGVFSQGETLAELEENIEDAYKLLMEDEQQTDHPVSHLKEILVEVV
jgi:predicted RNase H-like HicB family nuclease